MEPRRHHDLGGLAAGPVDREAHDLAPWEARTDALVYLLIARRAIRTDELRREIESLGPDEYRAAGYYHRWLHALVRLLLEKGGVTVAGLAGALATRPGEPARGGSSPGGLTPGSGPVGRGTGAPVATTTGPESGILQDDPSALADAVADLVVDAGLLDRETLETAVAARVPGPPPVAPVIVRAWRDQAFRARLLDDPLGACIEAGLTLPPTWPRVVVLDNAGPVHHVVACTLCSCHSRPLMGVPPPWYKGHEYRSRVVREPRAVLAEFGLTLDAGRSVRVQDASADLRYIVLPSPPDGYERVDDATLAGAVTPEVLLGVAHPALLAIHN